jgi:HK97 family phage major capsid protein
MNMQEIKERMQKALVDARAICDAAEGEKRDFSAEERQKVEGRLGEAKKLKEQLKAAEGDEAIRKAVMELGAGIDYADPKPKSNGHGAVAGKGGSIGEQFVNAEMFRAWMKQVAPTGEISESRRGLTSPPVEFRSFFRKELITGVAQDSAGAFITPDDTGIYEPIGRFPLVVRNLISNRQTTSDTVEFVRQTRQVTEAAPTPEANVKYPVGYPGEIDGTKPQGRMNFERVHETVKTIAVYVGATKRALSDAAQIRGIIDQELREDLADTLEDQIFNGNGVGENFTGLANQPGVLVQAFGADLLTTTRQAITTLAMVGRQIPTAWVFNPADWETVELQQDLVQRFYHGGPLELGPMRLWGVPVVQSFHKAAGTAYLANWRKAVLWDRERASISVTDSHDDWFIRNMIAILAEMRAAFGVIRPSAFVEVELS